MKTSNTQLEHTTNATGPIDLEVAVMKRSNTQLKQCTDRDCHLYPLGCSYEGITYTIRTTMSCSPTVRATCYSHEEITYTYATLSPHRPSDLGRRRCSNEEITYRIGMLPTLNWCCEHTQLELTEPLNGIDLHFTTCLNN
jgi:hypothetical protein